MSGQWIGSPLWGSRMFVVEIYAAVRHFVFIAGEESLGPRPTRSVGDLDGLSEWW
jgi:hypothetical protein